MKSLITLCAVLTCMNGFADTLKCEATFGGNLLSVDATYSYDRDDFISLNSNLIIKINGEKILNIKPETIRVYNDNNEVIALHYLNVPAQENFYLRYGTRGPKTLILKMDGSRTVDLDSADLVCNF